MDADYGDNSETSLWLQEAGTPADLFKGSVKLRFHPTFSSGEGAEEFNTIYRNISGEDIKLSTVQMYSPDIFNHVIVS